jgi:CHAT domain-containing protein
VQVATRGRDLAGALPDNFRARETARLAESQTVQREVEAAIAAGGFTPMSWKGDDKGLTINVADPPKPLIEAEKRLNDAQARWAAFEDELYRTHTRYASIRYPRPVPLSQVPLADDETVLEFLLGHEDSHVLLVEKARRVALRIPIGQARLSELVRQYLAPFMSGGANTDDRAGRELFDALLRPALALVSPGRRLVLVPDGALWTLPFETLPMPGSAAPFGDAWSVSYVPSLSVLALNRLMPAPSPAKAFFGVGDVALGAAKDGAGPAAPLRLRGIYVGRSQYEFPALPETRLEVANAARTFGVAPLAPDVLFGAEATESAVKQATLDQYRVLHLATHGVSNNDLAGVREPALLLRRDAVNDGILRASEVTDLRLGASLVVLAACKTGLGESLGGEGVMSMARVFQHAGARTVVMSLWNVPSEATSRLFATFYSELQGGRTPGEALRLARQAVRRDHPEPFYWGAFVLVGEGRL